MCCDRDAVDPLHKKDMMLSYHENIFYVADLLWGKSTDHRWISLIKSQQRGALLLSLMYAWANGQTNKGVAVNFRHGARVTPQ